MKLPLVTAAVFHVQPFNSMAPQQAEGRLEYSREGASGSMPSIALPLCKEPMTMHSLIDSGGYREG